MSDPAVHPAVRAGIGVQAYSGPLWRLYRTRGRHRVAWNQFRRYGSAERGTGVAARSSGSDDGMMAIHTAADALTAFAEVFYRTRIIDPSVGSGWALAGWMPTRELRLGLLDDPEGQPTSEREGATSDGTWNRSLRRGEPVITLLENSADSFPELPQFNQLLAGIPEAVAEAATRLEFGIRNY